MIGPSGVGKTTFGDTLLGVQLDRKTGRPLRPRFQKLHQDPASVFAPDHSFGASLSDLPAVSRTSS